MQRTCSAAAFSPSHSIQGQRLVCDRLRALVRQREFRENRARLRRARTGRLGTENGARKRGNHQIQIRLQAEKAGGREINGAANRRPPRFCRAPEACLELQLFQIGAKGLAEFRIPQPDFDRGL